MTVENAPSLVVADLVLSLILNGGRWLRYHCWTFIDDKGEALLGMNFLERMGRRPVVAFTVVMLL